jgi:hypothetical protein
LSHSSAESQEYAGPSAQPLTVDVAKLYKFFGQRVDIVKTADKQSRSNSTAASTVPMPSVVGHETPREPTFLIPVPDTSHPIRKSSSFTKSSSLSKSSSSISKSPSFRDDQVIVTSLERSRGSGSGEGKEPNGGVVGGSASNTADSLPRRDSRDTYDDPSSGGLEHDELSPDNPSNETKKSQSKGGGLPVTIHAPNPKFSPPIVNGPTPPPEKRRSSSSRRLSQGSHSSSGSYSVPKAASSPSFSLPLGRVRRRSSQKSANSAHSSEVGDILSSGLSSAVYALTSRLAQLAALANVDPGGEHLVIPPPDDNLQEDLNTLGNDHINGDEGDSEGDDDRRDSEDEEFIRDSDPAVTLSADAGASGTDLDVLGESKPKTLSVTSPHYRKASSFRARLERMDSSSPPDSPTSPTSPGAQQQQQQQRTIRKKSPFRQRGVSPYGTAPSKMMMTELEMQHATLHEDTEEERREKIREVQQAKKLRRMLGENVSVGEHNNAGLQIAPQVGTVNWKKLNRHFGVGVVESSSTPSSGSAISIQPSSRFSLVPMMDDIPEVHSSETDASSLRGSREHHVATTDESEERNDLQISESISDDEGIKLNVKEEPKEHSKKKRRDTADDSPVEHIQADSKPNVDPSVTDSFTT